VVNHWIKVNKKLEWMWVEAVMALLKLPSWHLPGEIEETCHGIQRPHQHSNQALAKYKPESLPLEPICSARFKSAHWPKLVLNRGKWEAPVHVEMKAWVPQYTRNMTT
jgi:hypothetical protein